jgi:uncharacterized protein (DUF2235 family)
MPEKRNLVICCDGTGDVYGDNNSNVVKLYSTLEISEKQLGYYHPGVGTMGAPSARNKLEEGWDIVAGLAFGQGLMDNIGDAYRFLMEAYREGDDIYLFGFSRGAYTARALAGLISMYGLLFPGNQGLIPYITRMYAKRIQDDSPEGVRPPSAEEKFTIAVGFRQTFSRRVPLHFVGVWDTVSSVGWAYSPLHLPYTAQNPVMKIGRHAISIDERRCYFRDNLWGPPLQPGEKGYMFPEPQNIKQVWFAGVHGDVGGGYCEAESSLAKLALEWMMREASLAGLLVNEQRAAEVLGRRPSSTSNAAKIALPDPTACIHQSLKGAWWIAEFLPHQYWDKDSHKNKLKVPVDTPRQVPLGKTTVIHESVQQRLDAVKDYRPPNLPAQPLAQVFTIEPRVEYPAAQSVHAAP